MKEPAKPWHLYRTRNGDVALITGVDERYTYCVRGQVFDNPRDSYGCSPKNWLPSGRSHAELDLSHDLIECIGPCRLEDMILLASRAAHQRDLAAVTGAEQQP